MLLAAQYPLITMFRAQAVCGCLGNVPKQWRCGGLAHCIIWMIEGNSICGSEDMTPIYTGGFSRFFGELSSSVIHGFFLISQTKALIDSQIFSQIPWTSLGEMKISATKS